MNAGSIFLWELLGTAVLILLGNGVVANHVLRKNNGHGGGPLFVNMGWGFAVFAGASVANPSGAHLNPAVTLGLAIAGKTPWADVPIYMLAQMVGAILGAALCWATYKLQFDDHPNPGETLGIFSTAPQIPNKVWNLVTEIIGTFVLVGWILFSPVAKADVAGVPQLGNGALGYAGVAFVVLVIGTSLGGPTGYAINPARDLGPRIAYAFLLPIRRKTDPNWGYSWVPVVGPLVGGALAALVFLVYPSA
ncbi:MIP/aquaporin family protein [Amycolatopsis anabasis]|uniref:MIP/aquaporin family protein n=1 Tax=Amycolatopsis anabasis TaxID=1840409 RepID=UPI00131D5AD9|nr:MIP/aquaporin family protein [Amycolatopsis anabasis]